MEAADIPPEFIRTDQITDLWSYVQTIDWSEGWLMGLLTFHVLLTAFTLLTRNHHATQAVLFFALLLVVRCSESINQYAAQHWRAFSSHQYFDSQGLFISVVFSMPVLFNCLMMVINWLWLSSSMMVTWKRAELEAKMRQEQRRGSGERRRQEDTEAKKEK